MQLVCWLQCRTVPKRLRRIVSGHVRGVLIGDLQSLVRV